MPRPYKFSVDLSAAHVARQMSKIALLPLVSFNLEDLNLSNYAEYTAANHHAVKPVLLANRDDIVARLPTDFPNERLLVAPEVRMVRTDMATRHQSPNPYFPASYVTSFFWAWRNPQPPPTQRVLDPYHQSDFDAAPKRGRVGHDSCLIQNSRENLLVCSLSTLDLKRRAVEAVGTLSHKEMLFLGVCEESHHPIFLALPTKSCVRIDTYSGMTLVMRPQVTKRFVLQVLQREFRQMVASAQQSPTVACALAFTTLFTERYLFFAKALHHCGVMGVEDIEFLCGVLAYDERFNFYEAFGVPPVYSKGALTSAWCCHPQERDLFVCQALIEKSPKTIRRFESLFNHQFDVDLTFVGVSRLNHTNTFAPVFTRNKTEYIFNCYTNALHEVHFMNRDHRSYYKNCHMVPDLKRDRAPTATEFGVSPSLRGISARRHADAQIFAVKVDKGAIAAFNARNNSDVPAMLSYVNQLHQLNCVRFLGQLDDERTGKFYGYFADESDRVVLIGEAKLYTMIAGKVVRWAPHTDDPYPTVRSATGQKMGHNTRNQTTDSPFQLL